MERAFAKTTDERIQNILRKKAEELEDTKQEKKQAEELAKSFSKQLPRRPQRNGWQIPTLSRQFSKTLNKNCLVLTYT
jgi:hypothetical protein